MALVILAALCVAGFAISFKYFDRYGVPLHPAVTVNYITAFVCGWFMRPITQAPDLNTLLLPSGMLGILFPTIFLLTGASTLSVGAARTTIAGRMSLILTVAANAFIFREHVSVMAWAGIGLSVAGLILTTARSSDMENAGRGWWLPLLVLIGSGACDIGVTAAQRTHTTTLSEGAFTTCCFGAAAIASTMMLFLRGAQHGLASRRTWIGGVALGLINYASLLLLVRALGTAGLPADVVFPLMNIGAILFGSVAGMLLFKERFNTHQWVGMALCISALGMIIGARA